MDGVFSTLVNVPINTTTYSYLLSVNLMLRKADVGTKDAFTVILLVVNLPTSQETKHSSIRTTFQKVRSSLATTRMSMRLQSDNSVEVARK
jgi:hypothetical protein